MHIRWIAPAVALLLIFSALAGQAAAETAVVAGKGVNVRSGPGMGYEVTDTLARGTVVEITAHTGSVWVAVRYPGGSGYMSSDYLEIAGPDLYLDTGNTQ
ncbi:MAG: SH3 domain-containing protein, partial [Oscillospiraceae bacterium]|nr:SH3 domain-containing protein [Oscillospiraceae bacterium]